MGLEQLKKVRKKYLEYLSKREKLERLIARPGYTSEGDTAKKMLEILNNKIAKYELDHPELQSLIGDAEPVLAQSGAGDNGSSFARTNILSREYYPDRDHEARFVPRYSRLAGHECRAVSPYVGHTDEDELYMRLGIIYVIFGTVFKINIRGYEYKVCFKELIDDPLNYAFCRVKCDILEDNSVIARDVVLGFCPFFDGDAIHNVRDMEISAYDNNSIRKYTNDSSRYKEIMYFMQLKWNRYFSPKELPAEFSDALDDAEFGTVSPSSSAIMDDPAARIFGLPESMPTIDEPLNPFTRRREPLTELRQRSCRNGDVPRSRRSVLDYL